MWESNAEMHQITGKLTRPKDFKTPKQLAQEKKTKEKMEKQRIREEILAAEPVTEMDTKLYSGYLASKSQESKSDNELNQEKQVKMMEKKKE